MCAIMSNLQHNTHFPIKNNDGFKLLKEKNDETLASDIIEND